MTGREMVFSLPGLCEAGYPLKGTVTLKEQNGKYFKAFSNIYCMSMYKISIYFCVLNGKGVFMNIMRNVYRKLPLCHVG